MGNPVLQRSFAAGELDPGISVRADLQAYGQGLRTCRNFLVRRSGGVISRPGLAHVADVKDSANRAYLFSFIFAAADWSYLVEAGDFYFRFHHRLRGLVLELATPYPVSAFSTKNPLVWAQSGLVVSLTHLNFPPMELTFTAPDTFVLAAVSFAPTIAPPTGLTGGTHPSGTETWYYQVTAVKADTYEESIASAVLTIATTKMPEPSSPTIISWDAVAGAVEYRVYRDFAGNGTFGLVGTATGQTTFHDIGVLADFAFTPPTLRPLFDSAFHYPAVSTMHKQRRIYAGTHISRDLIWASRVGQPYNFTGRSSLQDDDALHWRTVSTDVQVIFHLVTLGPLLMLTDRGEWVIRGDESGMLTPTSINPTQVGYVGAGWATPVLYGERLLFVQARETVVRELLWNHEVEGLSGRDLTRMAAHLFRGHRIVGLAFALVPDAILWCVRDDGVLLGLTYIPDEDVLAWHWHETEGGRIEQVCVIPEVDDDAVYVVVAREGGRSIERLGVREAPLARLDGVVRVRGAQLTRLTGLRHLAGREVRLVVDGRRDPGLYTVDAAGDLALPAPADVVDVGLPITAILQTLDLDVAGSAVRDQRKKITTLAVLVEDSLANFEAGPDLDHLMFVQVAPWQLAGERLTGRIELTATSYFNDEGRMFLRHTEPTTLTVLGLLPNVEVGG